MDPQIKWTPITRDLPTVFIRTKTANFDKALAVKGYLERGKEVKWNFTYKSIRMKTTDGLEYLEYQFEATANTMYAIVLAQWLLESQKLNVHLLLA